MPKPGEKKEEVKPPKVGGQTAPAKIVVSLPADATFIVDDYTSPAHSDTQIVLSSPLVQYMCTYVLKNLRRSAMARCEPSKNT